MFSLECPIWSRMGMMIWYTSKSEQVTANEMKILQSICQWEKLGENRFFIIIIDIAYYFEIRQGAGITILYILKKPWKTAKIYITNLY